MTKFLFWQGWLFFCSLFIIGFGLYMAFFNNTILFGLFDEPVEAVFWQSAPISSQAQQFQHWMYSVLGATMAGWGVFIAFVAQYPFKSREQWAWQCVAVGIVAWYLIDTSSSLSYGFGFNAVFNTGLLILVLLPLAFTYTDFFQQDADFPAKVSR